MILHKRLQSFCKSRKLQACHGNKNAMPTEYNIVDDGASCRDANHFIIISHWLNLTAVAQANSHRSICPLSMTTGPTHTDPTLAIGPLYTHCAIDTLQSTPQLELSSASRNWPHHPWRLSVGHLPGIALLYISMRDHNYNKTCNKTSVKLKT